MKQREIINQLKHRILRRFADGGKRTYETAFFKRTQTFGELPSVCERHAGKYLSTRLSRFLATKALYDFTMHLVITEERLEQAVELVSQFTVSGEKEPV